MNANGRDPAPLSLSTAQRMSLLHKIGLGNGWILLTAAEVIQMRVSMEGMKAENEKLSANMGHLLGAWIADQQRAVGALTRSRALVAAIVHGGTDYPPAVRIDAVNELAALDADLAHFAAVDANKTGREGA